MNPIKPDDFASYFEACHHCRPFDWQQALAKRVASQGWPEVLALPTAAGKTAVLDVALFALAAQASLPSGQRTAPRRIVFVVDRRVVVDATAERARKIAAALDGAKTGVLTEIRRALLSYGGEKPLQCAELRGGMWRDERWARTPLQPTVLVSTVDQVGSRLLHRGYGLSPSAWPIHAALLANDTLLILDEAHLSRAFEDTLGWIAKYRLWAERPIALPFQVVRMSATPGTSSGVFPEDAALVAEDPCLSPRLTRPKRATLLPVEKASDFPKRCAEKALLLAQKGKTVAVIVNRVGTARAIHELVKQSADNKRSGFHGLSVLLTGRCRTLDRDVLLQTYRQRLLAGRDRAAQRDAPPLIVVATQCVEAGADFDFDALVTECCPLDSLRQRFGRLNRIGELSEAEAVIVAGADTLAGKTDAIYGAAVAETWKWLNEQRQPLDFAAAALSEILPKSLEPLRAPTTSGPLIFPAYCNLWAQTSPAAAPSPDPAVFLHGSQRGDPDVQFVWRADLDADKPGTWLEAVTLSPPLTAETLSVCISSARAWLEEVKAAHDDTDVEGGAVPEYAPSRGVQARPFLVWRGRSDSAAPQTDATLLRPGDTVIVPAAYGGCDSFGWNPSSRDAVTDIADHARFSARRPVQLRLHPQLAQTWGGASAALSPLLTVSDEPEEAADQVRQTLAALAAEPPQGTPEWLRDVCRLLAADFKLIRRPDCGWVAVSRKRWSCDAADFDDAEESSAAVRTVPLADHLDHVEKQASEYAAGAGLPNPLRDAIRCAARYHDMGKADPRFQALLYGGDRAAAIRAARKAGGPLAKSPEPPRSRAAQAEAVQRSGYPEGGRHELLSVRMLEAAAITSPSLDADLVLHTIASHHGGCRPFAPEVADPDPVTVRWRFGGVDFAASSATGLESLDSGVAERFWTLIQRYGWWGLPYLETLVRLADHRVSERYDTTEGNV